ncbi:MAG: hypothetical protein IJF47_03000 [Candidatus Methanomethylophilaceae archaeon]|nr:hypothetical protein [Candidatus Methanomethylophilaceae archaeon]
MSSVGKSRRFECSLTTQELMKEGERVLKAYDNGKEDSLDPKYSGIIKDYKVRGYLRCGLMFDSLKKRSGETLRTTVEGKEFLRSKQ